ncbi:hypothetical protein [Mucilaginibacter arboris]|uniref:DUF4177 domain-containing protein n=1 Tax=Mucilaginibacter arboris TaxID=2682090 RepID=A0A7K1T0S4_9SPHI|nr:hypothetical protein [Mucilaginibacter arboris]MVN23159.1 hypothetical protein [Mucilaginibacter arboris]
MKKLLFLFWLLPAACFAQTDSARVKPHDAYCRIFVLTRSFRSGYAIGTDFGHDSSTSALSDEEINKLIAKLKTFDNEIDALNYMASKGWEVINYNDPLNSPRNYLLRRKTAQ